jgi:hypothetical protein
MSQAESKKRKAESDLSSDDKASSSSEDARKKLKVGTQHQGEIKYSRFLSGIAEAPLEIRYECIDKLFRYFASTQLGLYLFKQSWFHRTSPNTLVQEDLHLTLSSVHYVPMAFTGQSAGSSPGVKMLAEVTANGRLLTGRRAVRVSIPFEGAHAFITVFREGLESIEIFCYADLANPQTVESNGKRILAYENRRMLLKKRLYPMRIDHVVSRIMSFLGEPLPRAVAKK